MAQRHDAASLLALFERMIHPLCESPDVGAGICAPVDHELPDAVLAHRADGPSGSMLFLHNLGTASVRVDLGKLAREADKPHQVFGNQPYLDVKDLPGARPGSLRIPVDPAVPQRRRLTQSRW